MNNKSKVDKPSPVDFHDQSAGESLCICCICDKPINTNDESEKFYTCHNILHCVCWDLDALIPRYLRILRILQLI